MRLFDSNVIIYSGKPEFASLNLASRIKADDAFVSAISTVEVLGFADLTEDDRQFHESQFAMANMLPLDDAVLARTIALRQIKRRMSLGDALIAATALEFELILVTNNVADFTGITGLQIENPLDPPIVASSGGIRATLLTPPPEPPRRTFALANRAGPALTGSGGPAPFSASDGRQTRFSPEWHSITSPCSTNRSAPPCCTPTARR